ncbi:MAG: PVC-type heme-binding CxxCH protein, partial [Cyclobacteriaceae bacterium]
MKRINFKFCYTLLIIGTLFLTIGCEKELNEPSSKGSVPYDEALATFELEEGFQMELIAHEPMVADPVDMEIDEFGRLYVVEMPGYPIDKSGTGRVRQLIDRDGDGIMDDSIIFAEDLMLPNGILRWKNGFLVTDAPNVLYLEDTDGDGMADVRDTVLTGFSLSNPHVNVNNPVYGLDNWIHLAHLGHIGTRKYEDLFGDRGSEIIFYESKEGPTLPKNANGRSVRFRPDSKKMEMASSRTQFGHTFDRWGRYLLTHNQNHLYHEVLGASYLARNPDLLVSNASESISDHGNETEVFQITTNPDRQLFTPLGLTTSSSGITAYLGGNFPPPFNNKAVFVAESVSNLVHVDILEEKGASFVAKRHRDNKEFLASKDSWSRPVNMYVGPDGGLYVLDYYRRIIEHPEWMSDEAVEEGGLYD